MNGRQISNMQRVFSPKISKRSLKRWANFIFVLAVLSVGMWQLYKTSPATTSNPHSIPAGTSPAAVALQQLDIKGRAPKTGYSRLLFSNGWGELSGCDLRNFILARDLTSITYVTGTCKVQSGVLADPYTGNTIEFTRGTDTSDDVQIDHVVALGDAWQKGAQQLSSAERYALANDPLELLAADGPANESKGDSDAASWLPPNKGYRCSYVARQIAIKAKYRLWVTPGEYQAMAKILTSCPEQALPREAQPQTLGVLFVRLLV